MSALKLASHSLFGVAILLELLCAVMLLKRKLHREHYFFFCFLLFDAGSGILLESTYSLLTRSLTYFYVFWVQAALADIFAFAVFYELFCAAFKPFPGLRDMAQVLFRWAALALLLVGIVVFFSSADPSFKRVTLMVVNMERAVSVMQCGLLLFLLMGSSYLGLSKRSLVFGVSLGFGLMATINLSMLSLTSWMGFYHPVYHWVFDLAQAVTTATVAATWAFYVARPEPARETINVPVTSPLLRWNEVAMALGHSGGRVAFVEPSESFMPNVERMVEEVMKRDMFADRR
jgi:hypothetical protein